MRSLRDDKYNYNTVTEILYIIDNNNGQLNKNNKTDR